MREEVARAELRNVELRLHPFDFLKPVAFDSSAYLHALDRTHDLIVVDGQDWTYDVRPECFVRAEKFIRPGGVIVVDDSWRYRQLRTANNARAVKTFEGVGPCRVGVTSTDLYYY
jgi:predicted O-methyltransferase YrrM